METKLKIRIVSDSTGNYMYRINRQLIPFGEISLRDWIWLWTRN